MRKLICDRDCFNCSFPDCIDNGVTKKERVLADNRDSKILVERGERFYTKEHERKRAYEYYHGIRKPHRPSKRKVKQLSEDGTIIAVYNSLIEAASSIGLNRTTGICSCCKKLRHTAYGYRWEYADER